MRLYETVVLAKVFLSPPPFSFLLLFSIFSSLAFPPFLLPSRRATKSLREKPRATISVFFSPPPLFPPAFFIHYTPFPRARGVLASIRVFFPPPSPPSFLLRGIFPAPCSPHFLFSREVQRSTIKISLYILSCSSLETDSPPSTSFFSLL